MTPERKDIQGQEGRCDKLIEQLPNDKTLSNHNKALIERYCRDAIIGKAGKKSIGKKRLYRSVGILKLMANDWFRKDLDKVTEQEMEDFVSDMKAGKITQSSRFKKRKGRGYSPETLHYYLKFVQKFYRYLGKPELVNWINTSYKQKETQTLTKADVTAILSSTGVLRDKVIVQVLFDAGCRAEEFLNIKFRDISRKAEYYQINLRISKTRPRVVSVPMKESTELLDKWLIENKDADKDAFAFDISYHALTMMLTRIGDKAVGRHVHPHLFRHASMTYYANLLKHYPFAKRYGLSLNSDVVSRYIDLSGIDEEETANVVKATRELELEKQLKESSQKIVMLQEQMGMIMQVFAEHPELLAKAKLTPKERIEAAIVRKGEK